MHTGFQKDQGVGDVVEKVSGVFGSQARSGQSRVGAANAKAVASPSTSAFRPANGTRPIFSIMNHQPSG